MSELALTAGTMAAPNIRLERVLREGGMGSVWIAEHLSLKTRVAVKFMLLQQQKNAEAKTRFSREASAAAQIKSPHVVQVFDHGVNEQGIAYIVMELLEGEDLGTRLQRRGALPLTEVASIVSQAAKAMSKAHASGIVHRDIKPDNIFLMDVDGDLFVKVLDFGVAKTSLETAMNMTTTGVMMGTPFYMAPEQMANAKNAVPASDLWSLAVVAYESLTGKLPFQGETVAGLAIAVERGKFQPASEAVPSLPKAIDAWFDKALSREPEQRFASARELGDELNAIANPGVRRPMPSELSASYPDGMPVVAVEGSRARLPTQMGATLDGVPRSRKRGLAVVGITAAAIVAVGLVVIAVKNAESPAQGAPAAGAPGAGSQATSANAEPSAAPTAVVPPVEVKPAATAEAPSASAATPAPSATTSASASKATTRPTATWKPPPPPVPTHRGHGF